MPKNAIAIFNGRLLVSSETFVKAQGERLTQFSPYYIGARRVKGLSIPSERSIVVNQGNILGNLSEVLFKQVGFAPTFYKKIKTAINPVLIHAHFGVCGALALPISEAIGVPLVVTFHGFDASMTDEYAYRNSISTRVYLQRRERLKQETHLFIAVSNFIRTRLINQGFPENKIKVHYIGIDTENFQADSSILRKRQVLFVGRLVEKKGCEYLIRAMAKLQTKEPDVELIVIGDGPLYSELEALAKKSLKHYSFLGFQSPTQVKAWMNQASVLVAPSITTKDGDTEGLPMVILEAQAMGLPVISTNHAGIPEAIVDGDTGFLVPEGDWEALATRLEQLLKHSHLWKHISNKAQRSVRCHFNLMQQIKKLEAIYMEVLNTRPKT